MAQSHPEEVTLYQFSPASPSNGGNPSAGVIFGEDGVLYGSTQNGGTAGDGTVFSLTPPATPGGAWTETVLHSFTGGPNDGWQPNALAIGRGGVLYGTTYSGGSGGGGTVFALTPPSAPGGAWTETVLHNFVDFDTSGGGYAPAAGLTIGEGGVLYGTTLSGGVLLLYGTVFSMAPAASPGGGWTEAVLHSFSGNDGEGPVSPLVIGSGGVLYGTTGYGGAGPCYDFDLGCGTVFSLTPPASAGGSWIETVLHNFTGIPDGAVVGGGVTFGAGGVLYGTTEYGGKFPCQGNLGCGALYALTPPTAPGDGWTEAVLWSFGNSGGGNGPIPQGSLAIDSAGLLYGTTSSGGSGQGGTIFLVTPPAGPEGSWTLSSLYSFPASPANDERPYAGVVIGRGGVLYGTTHGGPTDTGSVFALKP